MRLFGKCLAADQQSLSCLNLIKSTKSFCFWCPQYTLSTCKYEPASTRLSVCYVLWILIIARTHILWKVMFLVVSVILFTGCPYRTVHWEANPDAMGPQPYFFLPYPGRRARVVCSLLEGIHVPLHLAVGENWELDADRSVVCFTRIPIHSICKGVKQGIQLACLHGNSGVLIP